MEKLFLGGFLAIDELNIVDHQHIDRAEPFLERHRILEPERPDKMVHELFGGQVNHLAVRLVFANMPGDRMHKMGLTKPHPAIEKQRVIRGGRRVGDPARGCIGQLVRLADDEIIKFEPGIQRGADIALDTIGRYPRAFGGPHRRFRGRLRRCRRADVFLVGQDEYVDIRNRRISVRPQSGNTLSVVICHPVAHKTRRHGQFYDAIGVFDQIQRFQPAFIGRVADFGTQNATDACPARIDILGQPVLCHATTPEPRGGPGPSSRRSTRDDDSGRAAPRSRR